MKTTLLNVVAIVLIVLSLSGCQTKTKEDASSTTSKMKWWEDARFGMFIHWGLYSIPAGEWNGATNHAEWIRTTAQIPIEVYDTLVKHFNPVNFNADQWVKTAKDAGMKYIVITSKHHDGFCLFDSQFTDFDVMSTPFKRDILAELAEACHKQGMVLCFYHSIMDWHNPDYLPRRDWEKNRSAEGADFSRYITYLKNQLKELTTKYGAIGVLWFDGEWEGTWTHEMGVDLYNYVESLQPGIIINNRVDKGRSGMQGMTASSEYKGDFGTPEQEVPSTGFPGVSWESCITLNDHWGYNKADNNWKSSESVIRMLADIASKGGNLLLNIGPKSDGTFPEPSIKILGEIGQWMNKNHSAIYGTSASPFRSLPWGRCTKKTEGKNTVLYLHVFDWPADGKLMVPGLISKVRKAYLLNGDKPLKIKAVNDGVVIDVPSTPVDQANTVIALVAKGEPVIVNAPVLSPESCDFIIEETLKLQGVPVETEAHYTTDGNEPTMKSALYRGPFTILSSATVKVAFFRNGSRISDILENTYNKVIPAPGMEANVTGQGLQYSYYEGFFDSIPDLSRLQSVDQGVTAGLDFPVKTRPNDFVIDYSGYLDIKKTGVYVFTLSSDDGSIMWVDGNKVIDNDGLHSTIARKASLALASGLHKVKIQYFQKSGDRVLFMNVMGPEGETDLGSLLVY